MKMARTTALTATQEPRLLAWDTEFWGIRIAQTDHPDVDQWAIENTIDLTCLLADPDQPEWIQQAEEQGFRYVDTRVELALDVSEPWYETSRSARASPSRRRGDGGARAPRAPDHALLRRPPLCPDALRRPLRGLAP
jgi:hypothetical protein